MAMTKPAGCVLQGLGALTLLVGSFFMAVTFNSPTIGWVTAMVGVLLIFIGGKGIRERIEK